LKSSSPGNFGGASFNGLQQDAARHYFSAAHDGVAESVLLLFPGEEFSPQPLINRLKQGRVDLNDPATTVALLKLNASLVFRVSSRVMT